MRVRNDHRPTKGCMGASGRTANGGRHGGACLLRFGGRHGGACLLQGFVLAAGGEAGERYGVLALGVGKERRGAVEG